MQTAATATALTYTDDKQKKKKSAVHFLLKRHNNDYSFFMEISFHVEKKKHVQLKNLVVVDLCT
jgi:hypothetical protein